MTPSSNSEQLDNNIVASVSGDLARRFEGIEIEALDEIYAAAAQMLRDDLRGFHLRRGSAALYATPSADVLALNRVIGLGLWESADEATIESLISVFRSAGAPRFFVQICPFAHSNQLVKTLNAKGFTFRNNWVKFVREAVPAREIECPFEIRPLHSNDAERFGHIFASSVDWPDWMARAIGAAVTKSAWRFYGAYDGNDLVATGGLYIKGDLAYLSLAATQPEYRGRGAQQKLAARRINDAIALGCNRLTVETADDTSDRSSPSFRNMIRSGFTVAYRRLNYLWEGKRLDSQPA